MAPASGVLTSWMKTRRGLLDYNPPLLPRWLRLSGAGPLRRPLLFLGAELRTVIYVDGFNLYFRALKNKTYNCKWLDIRAACVAMLSQENEIVGVKYFTARVSATKADPNKALHQQIYIRALQHVTPNLDVIYGQFATHQVEKNLVTPINGIRRAAVYETTEKGSDVNLAVHMVTDAWRNIYDCAVIVSGDSDLAEAIRLVKTYHQKKVVGVIAPGKTGMSRELAKESDFIRAMSTTCLLNSQMPNPIPNTSVHKPSDW